MKRKPAEPTKRQQLARALLKKFPDAGHRTLAKRLHDEQPLIFTSIESARSALRQATGNNGDHPRQRRSTAAMPRAPRKPGELPPLPKSEAKPWEPFVIDARRILVISDLHLPHHCESSLDASFEYGDSFGPDAILINGDCFDFYAISRWDRDPTKPKILAELAMGKQLFTHLYQRYPKARLFFKWGNHEERWDKYLWQAAPILFEIEEIQNAWYGPAGIIENKVTVIKDQRPIMLGKLPVFHGHELGQSAIASPVNPARGAFLRAHHTILVSHSHQTSGHADTNIWHEETYCWSIGALCTLTPPYRRVNRWNNGLASVTVEKDGSFNVQNLRISGGKVRTS